MFRLNILAPPLMVITVDMKDLKIKNEKDNQYR